MFDLFSNGLASLADRQLFTPCRREHLPEVHFSSPLPTVQVKSLDCILRELQDQAWSAFHQLEAEAAASATEHSTRAKDADP